MTAKSSTSVKEVAAVLPTPAPVSGPASTLVAATAAGTPLLAEVQSFIQKREELARKLADEITATEARLAELKRTAAALFPENGRTVPAASKEKKAKKLFKAKPLPPKTEIAPAANAIAVVDESPSDAAAG